MSTHRLTLLWALWLALVLVTPSRATADSALERGFRQPPESAKPWVYWFWLNGNISREGITADLEAMKRVGIGGVLIMEVDQGAPVGPADFMSQRWRELFRHVHAEARRLGLEVNMNNDAGWNGSGGPWIKPEESMQQVVWSETNVVGPARFTLALPQPNTVAGFYRDIRVCAFPTPGAYRIDRIRAKAAFEIGGVGSPARDTVAPEMAIDRNRIVDLTDPGNAGGARVWEVPSGSWTVVRFGHTSTGVENAPAPASGRGLECDKLGARGIEANFRAMMAPLSEDTRIRFKPTRTGLVATHIDSWENGSQNWSDDLRREFQQRRGYDLMPFLPVFTGRVVDSLETSERFLWDLRQTISELVIEKYAGRMRELAHAHGMRFTAEAYGAPCDSIPYAAESDEPMGEFWTPTGAIETCRAMASAGHVYGKRIIGAEAFTSGDQERWREHPALLKSHGDRAFCEGINRFVFHRYALQPWKEERRPGMMMGPWGQHYERTQTWWEWTPAWHEYLARCQFMLREGRFAADLCYVQPEAPPQGPGDHKRDGYPWDECTADAVLKRMSAANGRIVLPDGTNYRLLALSETRAMTPELLRKLKQLIADGATVLGPRPLSSPSLSQYPACDAEVQRLGAEVWGDCDGDRVKEHAFGKGRVVWGLAPSQVLERSGVPADFTSGQPLRFIHRTTTDREIYFVANPDAFALTTTASFRVNGKTPELWEPDTGKIRPAAMWREDGSRTHVVLSLDPAGSVFVVFRNASPASDPVVRLERGGQTVLAAAPTPAERVKVTQATYGAVEDKTRTRDVTRTVQQRADQGEFDIPAAAMAEGGDPAPGQRKVLRVDYEIEGKSFSVMAPDGKSVHLSRDALALKVETARYGVLSDPARTRDVRDRVQSIVDAGESRFTVARMAEGDDPAFLVVKTLIVEGSLGGRRMTFTGTDPEVLVLAPASAPRQPPAIARMDAKGQTRLDAREAGVYEWITRSGKRSRLTVSQPPEVLAVAGSWEVRFPPASGAPEHVSLPELISLTEHPEAGVKYFSGVATYEKTFDLPRNLIGSKRLVDLDLGQVEVMARVTLNGVQFPTLWKSPFKLDVSKAVKVGANRLRVEVVNLWPNRLVGDEQLPEDSERNDDGTLKQWPAWLLEGKPSPTGRQTFVSWRLWRKDHRLLPSGLMGPVRIVVTEPATVATVTR